MFKKEYVAPKMDVVEMKIETVLMESGGTDGGPEATEYDGEFGCLYNPEMDKKAQFIYKWPPLSPRIHPGSFFRTSCRTCFGIDIPEPEPSPRKRCL